MKKFAFVAIPVVIALLTFGISVKAMADVDQSGTNDTAVKATLNGNQVPIDDSLAVKDTLNDNKVSDIANSGDAQAEDSADHSAVANNGSRAFADDSTHIKISDISVAVASTDLTGEVSGNTIVFGNGLLNNSTDNGNAALAGNLSLQRNRSLQAGIPVAVGVNDDSDDWDGDQNADSTNKAKQRNVALQAAGADAGKYYNTQSINVELETGNNNVGAMTVNGVAAISLNSGVASEIQQANTVSVVNTQ